MVRDAANRLAQEPDVGRVADNVIAERLGISRKTVLAWRKKHQIRAWDDPRSGPSAATAAATAAAPAGAPTAPTPSVAAPKRAKPSRLDAYAHLLGTQSDRALAELAGVSPENVRMYRQRRGIEAKWRADGAPPTRVEAALSEFEDQLGLVPDATIAQRAGVSRSAVTQYRAKMGIVAGRRERARPPSAPIAEKSSAPPSAHPRRAAPRGGIGFEVTIRLPAGEETVTVIGADATAAIAAASSLGEVLALRRIGRVV